MKRYPRVMLNDARRHHRLKSVAERAKPAEAGSVGQEVAKPAHFSGLSPFSLALECQASPKGSLHFRLPLRLCVFAFLILLAVLLAVPSAFAQGATSYVVQSGDTLSAIAARFGTTVPDLARRNNIANPNLIYPGEKIVLDDDGASSQDATAAASIVPPPPDTPAATAPARPAEPDTPLPRPFASVTLDPSQPTQGDTVKVSVSLTQPARVTATYHSPELDNLYEYQGIPFVSDGPRAVKGLIGIHILSDVGEHSLTLTATPDGGEPVTLTIPVPVLEGDFPTQHITYDPQTAQLLDPDLRAAENGRLAQMFKAGAPEPMWDSLFTIPSHARLTSNYERRIANDNRPSAHEGLDFGVPYGTPIPAAAPGVVALAEPLTVRGNTVWVDHGMGVYTGYFHMSQILVKPGQRVETGTILGRVGSTGLSTGAHLHWEVRVNGVYVSPWAWLRTSFP
ncbi:MAG: LysM peptidoglycan-binding domain-containing M23 family metallopeptidase [Anaerolineae bacterium]